MPTLLFDIDGTLVRTGGAGKAAMEAALKQAFGVRDLNDTIPYGGRTDRAIGRDLLTAHGLDPSAANQHKLTDAYLDLLPHYLGTTGGTVCPGIESLLAAVRQRENVLLGLLTGNVRRGAQTKLGHFGLWDHFAVGGFGDDYFDRDDVARMAVRQVELHTGRGVNPSDVWIIGDTPLDVKCARAVGAKAVAVATGWDSVDKLAACEPDALFTDLSELPAVLKLWGMR